MLHFCGKSQNGMNMGDGGGVGGGGARSKCNSCISLRRVRTFCTVF